MNETNDEARRLNGMSADDAAVQMQTIWEQIQQARANGTHAEDLQQLYTSYLAAVDDYDMLTGQAPAHQIAANAMGGTNFFTHEIHPNADPAYDAAAVTDRFGRRTLTIPITKDMMAAAQTLERHLTGAQHNALWEAILHIESMKLTVDADSRDEESK